MALFENVGRMRMGIKILAYIANFDILGRMGTEGGDGNANDDQSIPAWCNSDVVV